MYIAKYYLVIKKELLPFVTTGMDLEGIMRGELRKTDILWPHLHVKSEKQNKQKQQNENRLLDTENHQVVARGKGEDGGQRRWRGLRHTDLYTENTWTIGMWYTKERL